MSPAPAPSHTDQRTTRQKGVLFCPECGHESSIDGDWQVEATRAGTCLNCPACGDTLTVRPRESADSASTTLPVFACSLAFARFMTRSFAQARRLCAPGVTLRDGPSRSPSATTDSPHCQP